MKKIEWTDEQLKVVLWAVCTADRGCPHCVSECIEAFIRQNDFNFSLLDRMGSLYEKEMNSIYEWKDLCPEWERCELPKRRKIPSKYLIS